MKNHDKSNKPVIIFDLDGTLLDINDRWYTLHEKLSKKFDYTPLGKKIYINFKRNAIPEKEIISKTSINPSFISKYLTERIRLIETPTYLNLDKLKDGVTKILTVLNERYILILLTKRRNKKNCLIELNRLKIIKFFSDIIVTENKTKEQAVKHLLNRYDLKQSFFIGDNLEDSYEARRLNMRCFLICDGTRSRKSLSLLDSNYLFNNLEELFNFINNHQNRILI